MARLGAIPEYRQLFEAAYPGTPFSSMTFAHASNAMAGFFVDQLTFSNTPWDHFLAGDDAALTPQQFSGANVFMGTTGKCAGCHNGVLFTDAKTRNVALAQFGPGEGNGPQRQRRLRAHQRDRRRHGQVLVQDAGAQKRRAHRPVRPRWAIRHAARLRRSLQRVGHQAGQLRREPDRSAPSRHAAADDQRHSGDSRRWAERSRPHAAADRRHHGVPSRAHRSARAKSHRA